jgi:hypothetical protein
VKIVTGMDAEMKERFGLSFRPTALLPISSLVNAREHLLRGSATQRLSPKPIGLIPDRFVRENPSIEF